MSLRRHALAAVAAASAVGVLTFVVAANGYRDFDSAFWLLNALSVGTLGYLFAWLVGRTLAREDGMCKRASVFAAVSGAVVAVLAFGRTADLNTSGVAVALVLASVLGMALGLASVEGLRWVKGASTSVGSV